MLNAYLVSLNLVDSKFFYKIIGDLIGVIIENYINILLQEKGRFSNYSLEFAILFMSKVNET